MTTHMTRQSATALIEFITEFIVYISTTQEIISRSDPSILSDHDDNSQKDLFDISLFNQYFSRQENKEQVNRLAEIYQLKPEFFVTITLILSHWVYALGYCGQVIKVRPIAQASSIAVSTY